MENKKRKKKKKKKKFPKSKKTELKKIWNRNFSP